MFIKHHKGCYLNSQGVNVTLGSKWKQSLRAGCLPNSLILTVSILTFEQSGTLSCDDLIVIGYYDNELNLASMHRIVW